MTKKNQENFNLIVNDINKNVKFNKLKLELHHGITRYDPSMRVAKWTYKVGKILKLKKINETTRAALLHDFFINEDLKGQSAIKKLNTHPKMALENSLKYYTLTDLQKDIIETHMFPCTLNLPKYKESWLVSLVDKIVSIYEQLRFKLSMYIGIYALFFFEIIKLPR